MKLQELQQLIKTDLMIIDHNDGSVYKDVYCFGDTFDKLSDKTIIAIRTDEHGYLVIGVR